MFWDNFVSLCTQRGTSPNAVAAELKKSSGSVTAWKNGAVPRETTLKKIADYFEISIDELLYDQKEKSPMPEGTELSEAKRRVIERILSGSDDQADFVLEIIERMK